ncbi:cytochrome c [Gaiella sp.]|jgi:mono/diheme cytochrome c family protein|uniref:c-type cytochrome n=1 Tax=Gaiella sp. TaxID=2663207 RepID=UPI002E33FF32|nr:cytochrome c [Gaiella sp.]HEX5583670.1 cytochrome c [Gaiella sp.]
MTDEHEETTPGGGSDGLWRWLVGGLLGGAVVLALLVAAYAIGHNRGEDAARATSPATTAPATTEPAATTPATTTTPPSTTTTTPPPETAPIEATPALVARGKTLFADDGCAACHSLSGAAGAGPALDGAAGRTVELDDGTSVTADDAYLERSLIDPDAQIVKGYGAGIMSAAVAGHTFADNPDDVGALVAFIKSQK